MSLEPRTDLAPRAAARPRLPASLLKPLRNGVLKRLETLQGGSLEIRDPWGRITLGPADAALRAEVEVLDPRFYADLAFRGDVGAGYGYARGWWTTPDLAATLKVVLNDPAAGRRLDSGLGALGRRWMRFAHRRRRNTRLGSKRNIRAHYDLGNDFFETILDPTLNYSCAVFPRPEASLEEASLHKMERICRELALGPEDHLVEIGTGWGSLAVYAASRTGCRVTTTTISDRQHQRAAERIRQAGLEARIRLLRADYRDLPSLLNEPGTALVSVEMIEAVGHEHLDAYFRVCREVLRPGGRGLIQAILILDDRYEAYRRGMDFIRYYIFPGGHLPSRGAIEASLSRVGGLRIDRTTDITEHYPETLRRWRSNLRSGWDRLRALGYPDTLLRLWEFYFTYCEVGFEARTILDQHLVLERTSAPI